MNDIFIRPAEKNDIPAIDKLLYEVHKVVFVARRDLFIGVAKKYTDGDLAKILAV